MKTCPVCKANCFDDMDICFGCLHDFSRRAPAAPQHARPPVLDGSFEEDLEPEEAVAPANSRIDRVDALDRSAAPSSQIAVAPGVHLDVPAGFRLVLSFEPSSE